MPGDGEVGSAGGLLDVVDDGSTLHLWLGNGLPSIEAGRQALAPFCARLALPPRVVNRLEVVFEEIVSNIVRHGFVSGSAQRIRVTASATPAAVHLRFEDDGMPFDPLARAVPPPLHTLADAPLGGLGIALVRKLAASISYTALAETHRPGGFAPVNRLEITLSSA